MTKPWFAQVWRVGPLPGICGCFDHRWEVEKARGVPEGSLRLADLSRYVLYSSLLACFSTSGGWTLARKHHRIGRGWWRGVRHAVFVRLIGVQRARQSGRRWCLLGLHRACGLAAFSETPNASGGVIERLPSRGLRGLHGLTQRCTRRRPRRSHAATGVQAQRSRHGLIAPRAMNRSRQSKRKPGFWRGRVKMAEDFDTLPEEVAAAFRGERP